MKQKTISYMALAVVLFPQTTIFSLAAHVKTAKFYLVLGELLNFESNSGSYIYLLIFIWF